MLWFATKLLAKNTKEDFTRRKIQDTVAAWSAVRESVPPGGFKHLNAQSTLSPEEMLALRKLEFFASCVNSGVYDRDIFSRVSGSWFLQQYTRVTSYIESRSSRNPQAYVELRQLYSKMSAEPQSYAASNEPVE